MAEERYNRDLARWLCGGVERLDSGSGSPKAEPRDSRACTQTDPQKGHYVSESIVLPVELSGIRAGDLAEPAHAVEDGTELPIESAR